MAAPSIVLPTRSPYENKSSQHNARPPESPNTLSNTRVMSNQDDWLTQTALDRQAVTGPPDERQVEPDRRVVRGERWKSL